MILEKPIAFFDIETTGRETSTDRIVQLAAIKFDGEKLFDEKNILVNPGIPIQKSASEVHGIYYDDIKDKPIFKQYAKGIIDYFEGCDIGGYNSNKFDIPILMAELKRAGYEFNLEGRNFIDAYQIEIQLNPRNLSFIYEKYTGNPLENAHDAFADIKATIDVFMHQYRLIGENKSVEEIDDFSQGEDKRVDLAGNLKINSDGQLCYRFGKYRDKPIETDMRYLTQYFLGKMKPPMDTVQIVNQYLKENGI